MTRMTHPTFKHRLLASCLRLGMIGALLASSGAALAGAPGLAVDAEKSAQTQRLEYAGQVTLSGVLQAYWVPSWPDGVTEQRTLFIRFFPDRQSQARLPRIDDASRPAVRPASIQLYRGSPLADGTFATDFPLETAIPLLDRLFSDIPPNFFRYKEGDALAAVNVQMAHLSSLVECDKRLFFGDFTALTRPPPQRDEAQLRRDIAQVENAADCGDVPPYQELYQVRSDSAQATALKARPDERAPVVAPLSAGQAVLKIRTFDDNWIQVRARSDRALPLPLNGDSVEGYIAQRHLTPIN